MPRQRNAVQSYDISKHRYLELYHYCMQYDEWKQELADPDCSPAQAAVYEKRCRQIEETAHEADEQLADYILQAVTKEWCTYKYLAGRGRIPCGHNMFYNRRRKFYYLMAKKMKEG